MVARKFSRLEKEIIKNAICEAVGVFSHNSKKSYSKGGFLCFRILCFFYCVRTFMNAAPKEEDKYITLGEAVDFMNDGKKEQWAILRIAVALRMEVISHCLIELVAHACFIQRVDLNGGNSCYSADTMTGVSQPCCQQCCCLAKEGVFILAVFKVGIGFWATLGLG